jgi:hypothetical protein
VRPLVFFYENLGVFVAYMVIGRDLAIGFRGVGMNEARPILEPHIRRGRRKMDTPSSTRILSPRFRFAIAPGGIGKLRLHPLPADDSVEY